jgi:acetyl-CoA C-acetyltransferase
MAAPDLASAAIKEVLRRAGINGDQIGEVLLGNVLSAGIGQAPARQAALKSGLPETVGATTINKVCGSGMKAVMMADQSLRLNQAQFIVAGGMESMSRAPFLLPQMRQGRKLGNAPAIDSMIHDGLCDPLENDHLRRHQLSTCPKSPGRVYLFPRNSSRNNHFEKGFLCCGQGRTTLCR